MSSVPIDEESMCHFSAPSPDELPMQIFFKEGTKGMLLAANTWERVYA
jgi:hypothetical protein